MRKLTALIAGSTGYIGIELIKLLVKHKYIDIKYMCGNTSIRKKLTFYDKSLNLKFFNCYNSFCEVFLSNSIFFSSWLFCSF